MKIIDMGHRHAEKTAQTGRRSGSDQHFDAKIPPGANRPPPKADGRSRSNWIVRQLQVAVEDDLRQKNITLLPAVADAEEISSSRIAESPDAAGPTRVAKTGDAIRGMVAKERQK
jgi:hypothetical protein